MDDVSWRWWCTAHPWMFPRNSGGGSGCSGLGQGGEQAQLGLHGLGELFQPQGSQDSMIPQSQGGF